MIPQQTKSENQHVLSNLFLFNFTVTILRSLQGPFEVIEQFSQQSTITT